PGVLVLDGSVYGAFASHCDFKPYSGYVARVNISTHTAKLWSDESGVTNNQGGIWHSGGGIMSDGSGRIFLTSGNGVSPPKGAGTSPGGQLAESVIRLAPDTTNGSVKAQDFFSPANAPSLDAGDVDYGAGSPVGVQFPVGAFSTLAQIGKDGRIWLLNRNGLGGRQQGPSSTDASLFVGKAYGGMWGHPAIFGDTAVTRANSGGTTATDNDFLFSVGKDDVLRVFRFAVASTNKPWLTNVANSSLTFGFTSGSPVVTSNGSDPTSAVIWAVYTPNFKTSPDPTGANSILEAYKLGNVASTGGTPSPCLSTHMCTLTNIWHSGKFTAAKFSIPATSQGWVYIGARDGHVLAFAAPSAAAPAAPLASTLPQTAVGSTSSQPVSVTATKTVTITGAATSTTASNAPVITNQFAAGQATETKKGSGKALSVTFPVTLKKGDKLSVQTSFTPTAPGQVSGDLSLSTSSTAFPTVDVPLNAAGTQEGIYAQPSAQDFPLAPNQGVTPVPVGIKKPEVVIISNLGKVTQTIKSVTPPSAPFTASNLPAVGTKLNPGASISVEVTYAPTAAGPATGSFTIVGSSGQKAVVTLTAIGTAAVSQLTAVPATSTSNGPAHASVSHGPATNPTVNFGSITLGKTATAYIQVSNTGNTQSLLNGVGILGAPFAAPLKPAVGLPFNPESDLSLPVTFTPTKKGTFTTHYTLRWRDVNGRHRLTVTITGTGV
ncbi:MAG TPA: choice-of-anchor D domain-containing protein, partial [Streptosporangiaceae bacterium]|nr:choice-of-anchor D domain-containing protein [Streptosporangiaceae bacterium]